MAAIRNPFTYHRDYFRDFQQPSEDDSLWNQYQKIAITTLPLLSLHRPCRPPLSIALSGARAVTQIKETLTALEKNNDQEALYQGFHSCLTTAAFCSLFFQPVLGYAITSCSDLLGHMREIHVSLCNGDMSGAGAALFQAILDGLFLGSFLYGAIEITISFATLQILLELYTSAKHWQNGDYFESFCQAILATAHLNQAIPQYRLAQWKYESGVSLEGTLRRNDEGFVYLDIPDEQIFSLLKYCGKKGIQPPPYFKPGMAGGHISVILANEKTGDIPELGRKFSFRIAHADSFDQATKRIHLVAVACSDLEGVRSRQGLSSRLYNDHDFHITYGIENF